MTLLNLAHTEEIKQVPEARYLVIHPLDDAPEQKVDVSQLGRMPMTRSVKLSLIVLRGYLVLMSLLVLYQVVSMAGIAGR
jgi:hypothetical protein